ncbi:MAG: YIP1 family protein [Burkholderiaceae bacterium]|jgi:hypothetical protein|nr:YIP1 family protein [Burkholderiaceae bacterium]
MNLIDRIKNILLSPKTEWQAIASEPATVPGLYKSYIAIIAAAPALAGFIKSSLIGYGAFGLSARTPIANGLIGAIIGYALSLALVYVMALIVNTLAPIFGGRKNLTEALKTVAYAATASCVASIGLVIAWLGLLIVLAGSIYNIYLLYRGLPVTMKCPPEKAAGYTAISVVCAIVLSWSCAIATGMVIGGAAMASGAPSHAVFDQNTWPGKMEAANAQMNRQSAP